MADIFDYLKWRGDVPFSTDEFNDVDNLILAELTYTHFEGILPEDGSGITLAEARDAFFACHSREEIRQETNPVAKAPLLMDWMLTGRRFGSVVLTNYENVIDADKDAQFCAVTYILDDGTAYVAYRGTDSTIVGWKEDFNMSFLPVTEGQRLAADYLNRMGSVHKMPFRVGGHSKGGNFAVYASAFARSDIRDRILQVYCNDGPGFRKEIQDSPEYAEISSKVISIVPDTSVIGMLLTNNTSRKIVRSAEKGLLQHDGLTWQVERNRFVTAEMSDLGIFIRKAQKDWLSGISDERREQFVNSLFSLFKATGMETFGEMSDSKLKSAEKIITAMQDMPFNEKMELLRIIGELIQSGGEVAWESASDFFIDGSVDTE